MSKGLLEARTRAEWFMEGPSNLRHDGGHAKEIHTNGSNIYTARNNLVFMNRIRIYPWNKYVMSSYCVHSPVLGVRVPR